MRNGATNLLMAVEPKAGQRIASITERRGKIDFVAFMDEVIAHQRELAQSSRDLVRIFQRKTLRNASFASIDQLIGAIRDFTVADNENATPFVWRKWEMKGSQLRNTIVNLRN